jgi:hypothetical protein
LVGFHFFLFVSPSSGKFQCTLSSLDTCVHKKSLVISKDIVKVFLSCSKKIVMNSPWGEGNFLSLGNKSL